MELNELSRRLAPSFLPPTGVLEMTYACNHSCIFCSCPWYNKTGNFEVREEMGISQWKKTIQKLCEMGVCNIAFTGGEPLLKKGIEEIITFAGSCVTEHINTENGKLTSQFRAPDLFLLSNGLTMRNDILDLCKEYKINLSLSLPGLRTFKEHTGVDNAKGVLGWFEKAVKKGVSTTVGITVTKKNLEELFEVISAAFLAGAGNLLMNRFLPGGRGIEYASELCLDKEQIKMMMDIGEEVLNKANRQGSMGTELPKCITNEKNYKYLEVATRCSAALGFFVVDPSGFIRVCNHSPIRLNHVDEIEKVKDHPYWKTFIRKDYLPDECGGCNLSTVCDGGCREAAHIVGGKVNSLDPLLMD